MGTDADIEDQDLPFAWEQGPPIARPDPRQAMFRLPTEDDPVPGAHRLLGITVCASVLGLVGLAVAVRGLVAIVAGPAPSWYEPTLPIVAAAGVGFVVAAFLSIHRRALPWLLLAVAAVILAVNVAATMQAV